MDARAILDALASEPAATMQRLRAEADPAAIEAALIAAPDAHRRQLLCDLVGFRRDGGGVEALIACLDDDAAKVRSSAADALAKLADPRAGAALLARALRPEPDPGVLRMMAAALGAVGHREAVPQLVAWLSSTDASLRGSAAWSLGALRATEARPALAAALAAETAPYPADRLRGALAAIDRP